MKYYYMFVLSLGLIVYLSHEPHIEIQSVQAETPQIEETVKEQVVAEVKHEPIAGPKYTIRVGLDGKRKPIPRITADTFDGRAGEWLATVGLEHTLPAWQALGGKYKIDYTLPLCIAWQDSHLGKALKTKNNIGNVGNNDRGAEVHFATLDQGIEAIFKALNNKYMGGNTSVGQLTGEGRIRTKDIPCADAPAPKKCYASSQGHGGTNIINCLSAIHDTQIDENYLFRIQ